MSHKTILDETKRVINFEYEPHAKAIEAHRAMSYASPYTIINLCAGRRASKTTTIITDAILKAVKVNLDENGNAIPRKIWICYPTAEQCSPNFYLILQYLRNTNVVTKRSASKGNMQITFNTGSIISLRSTGSGASLLGSGIDVLYVDEICDHNQETLENILFPMLATCSQPKIILAGTPLVTSHFWYSYFLRGKDKSNTKEISLHWDYTSNPRVNMDYIRFQESVLPKRVFQQQFLAMWLQGSALFDYKECINNDVMTNEPVDGEKYFGGLDVSIGAVEGKKSDYTVFTICNSKGNVVFIDRWKGNSLKSPAMKKRIIATYFKFNLKRLFIEKSNQNTLYQDLKYTNGLKNIEEWNPTSNKQKAIYQLMGAFEDKAITIPNKGIGEILCSELDSYRAIAKKSGVLEYGNGASCQNDDCVASLYILWQCFLRHKNRGGYSDRLM